MGERARLVKAAQAGLAAKPMAKQDDRAERLAAALRENLRKRKAQGREVETGAEEKKLDPGSRLG